MSRPDAQESLSQRAEAILVQKLTIEGWVPEQVANGSHGGWFRRYDAHGKAVQIVGFSAKCSDWRKVDGRARLEIVLIFPNHRKRDTDNLYARVKGLVDGIKPYIVDDDSEHLDLHVSARVEKGKKAVEMILQGLEI